MNISDISLVRFNMIIVFDKLDLANVSFDTIKSKFDNQVQIHQLQENLAIIVLNDFGMQVQIEQNRLVFVCQNNNIRDTIDSYPNVIENLLSAVTDSNITAFGYNYNGNFIVECDGAFISKYFMNKFECNWEKINEISEGEVSNFNPNFTIDYETFAYNIKMDSSSDKKFNYHLNVHYGNPGDIKMGNGLSEDINKHYSKFTDIIKRI